MKRIGNLYDAIVDIEKIEEMAHKVKLSTKNKNKIEKFENNHVSNVINIKNTLEKRNYAPGKYNIFIIKEPKLRLIMSQNIIDKIINHLASHYFLVKVFDDTLINENIATRKNKGTDYGIKLIKKYLNEIKDKDFYVLKFDISKYFFNLDHEIIKGLIRKKIKDKDVLKMLDDIIDSTNKSYVNKEIRNLKQKEIEKILNGNSNDKEKLIKEINALPEYKYGKGLPIGNMSSQILAIMYLNELDHFIKEKLNIKYYVRYMDDGIIIHEDKEYLRYCLKEIESILTKYKLELNKKTQIINIKNGFEFLGYKFYVKNNKLLLKVKNQTKKRFKRKLKNLDYLVNIDKVTPKEFAQVKASYLGHLHYGNTNNLINKTIAKLTYNKMRVQEVIIEDGELIYKDCYITFR